MTVPALGAVSVCYETDLATNQNTVSCNFDSGVAAKGKYLLACATYEPSPITRTLMGVTYAGVTCSYIAHIEGTLTSPDQRGAVFGLRSPAAGNNAFNFQFRSATANAGMQINAVVYSGVDLNDPIGSVSSSYAYLLNEATVGKQTFRPKAVGSRVVAYMSSEGGNLPLENTIGWSSVLQREMVSGYGTAAVLMQWEASALAEHTATFTNSAGQPYANLPYTMITIELRQSGTPALMAKRRRGLEQF